MVATSTFVIGGVGAVVDGALVSGMVVDGMVVDGMVVDGMVVDGMVVDGMDVAGAVSSLHAATKIPAASTTIAARLTAGRKTGRTW